MSAKVSEREELLSAVVVHLRDLCRRKQRALEYEMKVKGWSVSPTRDEFRKYADECDEVLGEVPNGRVEHMSARLTSLEHLGRMPESATDGDVRAMVAALRELAAIVTQDAILHGYIDRGFDVLARHGLTLGPEPPRKTLREALIEQGCTLGREGDGREQEGECQEHGSDRSGIQAGASSLAPSPALHLRNQAGMDLFLKFSDRGNDLDAQWNAMLPSHREAWKRAAESIPRGEPGARKEQP